VKGYNTSENTWELRKPQQLCKNTSALWEEVTRLNCQKSFDMLSKNWNKVSGWGVFSSSSLSLLIFFNRQRVFCLAQSWVWHNVLQSRKLCKETSLFFFSLKNLDFSLLQTQFSDFYITLTHEWPWWVHSAHLKCNFIITQRVEWLKQ
jgi:hypothetical protein